MSNPSVIELQLEDWFFDFYDALNERYPEWDHEKVTKIAEDMTMERQENEGEDPDDGLVADYLAENHEDDLDGYQMMLYSLRAMEYDDMDPADFFDMVNG